MATVNRKKAPSNPKLDKKSQQIETSWQENAAAVEFGRVTLAQYKAKRASRLNKQSELKLALQRVTTLRDELETLDLDVDETGEIVVAGVVGDVDYGPDSALYGGMGYVRKSQRKSGKTNKPPTGKLRQSVEAEISRRLAELQANAARQTSAPPIVIEPASSFSNGVAPLNGKH